MSRPKKTGTGYLNAVLLLLLLITLYKIGGMALVMILLTLLIGFGAIYISGESLSFRRKVKIHSLEQLLQMSPYRFESFIADFFRDQGYTVYQTKRSNDGGKDLVMYRGSNTYYVECKRYAKSNPVDRTLIQKLVGACHPVGADPIFVTTSRFTKGAIMEAQKSGVRLIDGSTLLSLLN